MDKQIEMIGKGGIKNSQRLKTRKIELRGSYLSERKGKE